MALMLNVEKLTPLPKNTDIEDITLEKAIDVINKQLEKKPIKEQG